MPFDLQTNTDEREQLLHSNSDGAARAHRWRAFLHASVWKAVVVVALMFAGLGETRAAYAPLFAQTEEEAAAEGPSYIVDALLLTLLVGGAVFAVCRAGRRN